MSGLLKLILREDVLNLGQAGEVVKARAGYARNFLLPQGKAEFATEARVKQLEHQRRVIEAKRAKDLNDLQAFDKKIRSLALQVAAKAGEEGKLFGSVTSQQICQLLAEKGIDIDRRKIDLGEPIKTLGEHVIRIKLDREVPSEVKLVVVLEE